MQNFKTGAWWLNAAYVLSPAYLLKRACFLKSACLLLAVSILSACHTISVSLDSPFKLGLEHTAQLESTQADPAVLAITFTSLEDSRCPQGVECIWAGEARVTLEIAVGSAGDVETQTVTLSFNESPVSTTAFGYKITLSAVAPYPGSNVMSEPTIELTVTTATEAEPVQQALDAAQARWQALASTAYVMEQRYICFCPATIARVTVTNAEIVEVEALAPYPGEPVVPLQDWQLNSLKAVPELFALIQKGIDDNAAQISVTYAEEGYPVSLYIDWDERIADEETGYAIDQLDLL